MNTVKTYIDIDGVLAQFEQAPNAMERFATEKGFFNTLKPTRFAFHLGEVLSQGHADNFFILTASPNEQADKDKRAWVKKHLPKLADRVVIVRDGADKAQYAEGNYLIDDYTSNLKFWTEQGGKGIKALNGLNGKTMKYKEVTVNSVLVDW